MSAAYEMIQSFAVRLTSDPELARKLPGAYRFLLSGQGGGDWIISAAGLSEAASAKADCTLELTAQDLVEIGELRLNPQVAFMASRLRVSGDVQRALRLVDLIYANSDE